MKERDLFDDLIQNKIQGIEMIPPFSVMDKINPRKKNIHLRYILASAFISLLFILVIAFYAGKPILNFASGKEFPKTSLTLDMFMAQGINKKRAEQKPILVFFSDNENHSENINYSWAKYINWESLNFNPNADQVRWVQTFLESPIYNHPFHHNKYQDYIPEETNQSFKTQRDFYEYYIQLNFHDIELPFALLLDSDLNILVEPLPLKNGNYNRSTINNYIKKGLIKRYARLSEGETLYTSHCASCHEKNTPSIGGITLEKNRRALQGFVKNNIIKNTSPSHSQYKHQFTQLSEQNIDNIFLHMEDIHFNIPPSHPSKKEFAHENQKISGDSSLFNVDASGPVDSLLQNGAFYRDR